MKDTLAIKLYESIQNANKPRAIDEWHASELAKCPRANYFARLGVKPLGYVGAGKMLRWQAGHIIEEVIRPHLKSVYPDLESNVRLLSKKLDLTGEYDNYSEKEEMIIEVKSVHDFAFAYKKKGDERFELKGGEPYLNHELQNHSYVKLLNEIGKPVSSITYVYITLDGRIATYKTEVQQALLDNVSKRLDVLNTSWANQTPPDCICREDHPLYKSTMQYCEYRDGDTCCDISLQDKLRGSDEH